MVHLSYMIVRSIYQVKHRLTSNWCSMGNLNFTSEVKFKSPLEHQPKSYPIYIINGGSTVSQPAIVVLFLFSKLKSSASNTFQMYLLSSTTLVAKNLYYTLCHLRGYQLISHPTGELVSRHFNLCRNIHVCICNVSVWRCSYYRILCWVKDDAFVVQIGWFWVRLRYLSICEQSKLLDPPC